MQLIGDELLIRRQKHYSHSDFFRHTPLTIVGIFFRLGALRGQSPSLGPIASGSPGSCIDTATLGADRTNPQYSAQTLVESLLIACRRAEHN